MTAVALQDFVVTLEKSHLLSAQRLAEARKIAAQVSDSRIVAKTLIKQGWLTRWQAAQLLVGHHGLSLGKYTLLDQLDRGGSSCVYLAEHTQMARRVVLKTLRRAQSGRADALQRFLSEARGIANLDHRNLIHVFDFDSERDRYYLVMEYVEGRDLYQLVQDQGPLPFGKVAEYVSQAADGLAHAHSREMVHGEVTPTNLWGDDKGTIKVRNLGVSRLSESDGSSSDNVANVYERLAYLAPEQRGRSEPSDHRADIYSLGATCYYLLTGKPPVKPEAAGSQDAQPRPDPRKQRPGVPAGLADICKKMMAWDPAERFQTAAEVAEALRSWKTQYQPPAVPPRKRKPGKSRPAVAKPLPGGKQQDSSGVVAPFAIETGAKRAPARSGGQDKSSSAVPSFGIETGVKRAAAPGRKASGSAPAKPASKSVPAAGEPGEAAVPRRSVPWLWIAAGIGGLALLGIVVVVIVALAWWGGSSEDVALNDPPAETVAAGQTDGVDEGVTEPGAEKQPPSSGEEELPPLTGSATDGSGGEDADSEPSGGQTDDAAGGGATAEPENGGGDAAGPDGGAPEVPEPPSGKAPDDGNQEKPAPKPVDPPKPKPTPTPKPKPKPKPKPQPAKSPFADFSPTVKLPPIDGGDDSAKEVVLGAVNIASDAVCYLDLGGGENAYKGDQTFSVRRGNNGLAERDWEILRHDSKADGAAGTKIADLSLREKDLVFQWTAAAKTSPATNHLRNCMLNLRSGSAAHAVALRQPVEVAPFVVQLDKGKSRSQFDIPWPPAAESVQVEITKLEGKFPNAAFEPQQVFEAVKGAVVIKVGEAGNQPLLFRVDSVLKAKLQLTMTPYFLAARDAPPQELNRRNGQAIQSKVEAANFQKPRVEEAIKKLRGNSPQEKRAKQQLEQQLNIIDMFLEQMDVLKVLCEGVSEGRIHFRVFYAVDAQGSQTVDLLRSSDAALPAEPAAG